MYSERILNNEKALFQIFREVYEKIMKKLNQMEGLLSIDFTNFLASLSSGFNLF